MKIDTNFLIGLAIAPAAFGLIIFLFKTLFVSVPEGHEVLELSFGKLVKTHRDPGLVGPGRLLPWKRFIEVSRQWDERILKNIESNDAQGTSVQVDVRVTFRIVDANKALFGVDNWEEALESSTVHEAAAELAGKDRELFLRCAPELSSALTESLRTSMATYGIEIAQARMMNVQLRDEVARQMFEAVAAKLDIAKAEYEERGRTDAALLLARTEQRVAELEARAKTESLKAVGRAYSVLRQTPALFEAYEELYKLSQIDPARVVSFGGFGAEGPTSAALAEADLELDGEGGNGHGRLGPRRTHPVL